MVRLSLPPQPFYPPSPKLTIYLSFFTHAAVAAGENLALATLTNVLNYIKIQKINMKKLQAELTEEQLRGKVSSAQLPRVKEDGRLRS